ncbi:MAG TPA: hypothetical protein VGI39_34290 [Polyangiaceae bacterium]|jgi:hypothetical protein
MTATLDGLPLDCPIPIADLARWAKLRTRTMRRRLLRLRRVCPACGETSVRNDGVCVDDDWRGIRGCGDASSGPGVLIRVRDRWMVQSLNALRALHWADFGKRFWTTKDAEEVVAENKALKRDVRALQARVRELEGGMTMAFKSFREISRTQLLRASPQLEMTFLSATAPMAEEDDEPEMATA